MTTEKMENSSLLQQQSAFQSDFEKNFLCQPENKKVDYPQVTPQENIDIIVTDEPSNLSQASSNQSTLIVKHIVESNNRLRTGCCKFNNYDRHKWDQQSSVLKQQLQAQEAKLRRMQTTKVSSLTRDLQNIMTLQQSSTEDVLATTSSLSVNKNLKIKYDFSQYLVDLDLPRGPKYKCVACDDVFNTKLSMHTHMKMHQKPFCSACFIVFSNKLDLHNHIQLHHPDALKTDITLNEMIHDNYQMQLAPVPPNTPSCLSEDECPYKVTSTSAAMGSDCQNHAIGQLPEMQFSTLPSLDVDPAMLLEHKPLSINNYSNDYPFQFENDSLFDGEVNSDLTMIASNDGPRRKLGSSVKKMYRKAKNRISNPKRNVLETGYRKHADADESPFVDRSQNMKKVTTRFGREINVKMAQY